MSRSRSNKITITKIVIIALMFCGIVLFTLGYISNTRMNTMKMSPWQSIGGCGGGGSGGGGGDGIKWIGNGVAGGLIDIEFLPKIAIGQNFRKIAVAPRFSSKLSNTVSCGLSIPLMSTTAEVQFVSNQAANDRTTGGIGDIAVDFSKAFGTIGDKSVGISLTFPTGQYDIKRGPDNSAQILPANLQKGSGLYNAGLTIGKTIDIEDGIILLDMSYSHPFAARPFLQENEFLDEYYASYKGLKNDSRFYYKAKPYGENDLGAFTPPSIAFSGYYAYRKKNRIVLSWGAVFGIPLGVAWVPSERVGVYDPRPDPDHKAWSAAIVHGIEFKDSKFPTFFSISLPIQDKKNTASDNIYDEKSFSKWDAPDFKNMFQQWTFALGIKTYLF